MEFLRMLLTIWLRCAAETGRPPRTAPVASERCFAWVRLRTSLESVRFSCCSRDNVCGVGCDNAWSRSVASVLPCCAACVCA